MREIINFEKSTRCIAHLRYDEGKPNMPYYQVEIYPDMTHLSPSGEFIRFNFNQVEGEPVCELHGWMRVDDILIDEVLEEYEGTEEDGQWVKVA